MTFNTFAFLGFFLAVTILSYALPGKLRPYLAAVASLAFYALYDIKITAALFAYIVYVYFFAKLLESRKNKALLAAGIVIGLVPLLICKYLNFGLHIADSVIGRFVSDFGTHAFSLIVPLGISYFTFKSIGYLVDVYKGKCEAEKNFAILSAFIAFFPEMLAGPIDRSDNLLKQLKESYDHSTEQI